jgi:hypothetical protein
MRAARARRTGFPPGWRALMAIIAVVAAGAAWAEADEPPAVAAPQVAEVPGLSNPPQATARLVALPAPASAPSTTPRGGSGGDDRRLLMLMMLGHGSSGGPFGRLGQ